MRVLLVHMKHSRNVIQYLGHKTNYREDESSEPVGEVNSTQMAAMDARTKASESLGCVASSQVTQIICKQYL